jgi:hypothetical protein
MWRDMNMSMFAFGSAPVDIAATQMTLNRRGRYFAVVCGTALDYDLVYLNITSAVP